MNKKLIGLIVGTAISGACFSASAQGAPTLPWSQDFEDPKLLTVHVSCDEGTSEFKSYLDTPHTFTGITIKWKGGMFYIYSPNPDSMSPITFSFLKKDGEELKEISVSERNWLLYDEAPQLYDAMLTRDTRKCKTHRSDAEDTKQ